MATAKPLLHSMELLTPAEVASIFGVGPKTVTRWARGGKLTSVKTLGGHRRYSADQVRALYEGLTSEAFDPVHME